MALEKIDKIKKVSQKLKPLTRVQEPNKDYFDALMQQKRVTAEKTEGLSKDASEKAGATLFDEVRSLNQRPDVATRSSPNDLVAQAEDVIAQIDTLKTKLETPELDIKSSVQTLLRNKLNHIDENLKVALDKTGSEYAKPERSEGMSRPIDRFLGLLTHSQNQLETLASDVKAMAVENEMSPASMLLIQIKVAKVQQEIELFTSMLNKALESTKTIMNVQV
jgi:flagellar hook-basal body complex protein FliE